MNGDEGLGLRAVRNSSVLDALVDVVPVFEEINRDVETILTASTELFEMREASDTIILSSEELTDQARELADQYADLGRVELIPSLPAGLALAAAPRLILCFIGASAYSRQRPPARQTADGT